MKKLISKLFVLITLITISVVATQPEENSVYFCRWHECYNTGISFAYVNGEFVPSSHFANHIIINYKLISNDKLDVTTKDIIFGDTIHYYCRLIPIKYNDYAKADSANPGNVFNGFYYSQTENFAYALDYSKKKMIIYWPGNSVVDECSVIFHQSHPASAYPTIEVVEKQWFLTYNGISPSPMTGVYQIKFKENDELFRQILCVDWKEDGATNIKKMLEENKGNKKSNFLYCSNGYVNYRLLQPGSVILKIFNLAGKRILSYKESKGAGMHRILVENNFSNGKYFALLQTGNFQEKIFFNLVR